MTNKVSLDKSKIKYVLLEGVHQSALDTLHAAGYTNIDFYKKACRSMQGAGNCERGKEHCGLRIAAVAPKFF